ncbi:hypothetical protein EJB05_36990 [Eragrostis curvula]|uniref:Uncharacterized protein n=1 Tax=Eragrostis curvula TaxID=38414 RepID=A0A5J9U015_9POAL|nr:hypothetical protein EJB05_36990 [Eragrostis curvula]
MFLHAVSSCCISCMARNQCFVHAFALSVWLLPHFFIYKYGAGPYAYRVQGVYSGGGDRAVQDGIVDVAARSVTSSVRAASLRREAGGGGRPSRAPSGKGGREGRRVRFSSSSLAARVSSSSSSSSNAAAAGSWTISKRLSSLRLCHGVLQGEVATAPGWRWTRATSRESAAAIKTTRWRWRPGRSWTLNARRNSSGAAADGDCRRCPFSD